MDHEVTNGDSDFLRIPGHFPVVYRQRLPILEQLLPIDPDVFHIRCLRGVNQVGIDVLRPEVEEWYEVRRVQGKRRDVGTLPGFQRADQVVEVQGACSFDGCHGERFLCGKGCWISSVGFRQQRRQV